MLNLFLHADGSCGPRNPLDSATYAYIITNEEAEEIKIGTGKLGNGKGNNYAEFYGLYEGLRYVLKLYESSDDKKFQLFVKMDSMLVINILKKKWKASEDKLYYPAYKLASETLKRVKEKGIVVFIDWIPRKDNQEADSLSKYQNFQ